MIQYEVKWFELFKLNFDYFYNIQYITIFIIYACIIYKLHTCMYGFWFSFFFCRTKFPQLIRKKDGSGKDEKCQEKLSEEWYFSSILTVQEGKENPDEHLCMCPLNLRQKDRKKELSKSVCPDAKTEYRPDFRPKYQMRIWF